MSEENYLSTDTFVSKALNQTQTTADIKVCIKEVKFFFYQRLFAQQDSPSTTFLQNKFLSQRNKQIEQEWSFTIEDLLLKYKGEKPSPKRPNY